MRLEKKTVFAFTLIELLIVVAIIAILAAIAVPNFLEAQVRSKISRVKSDARSLATAMEAYAVDYTNYAWPSPGETQVVNNLGSNSAWQYMQGWNRRGYALLTTPVSYISSPPTDPFREQREHGTEATTDYGGSERWYQINGINDKEYSNQYDGGGNYHMLGAVFLSSMDFYGHTQEEWESGNTTLRNWFGKARYVIVSPGPIGITPYEQSLLEGPSYDARDGGQTTYDPTNGTRSKGLVYRLGPG